MIKIMLLFTYFDTRGSLALTGIDSNPSMDDESHVQ